MPANGPEFHQTQMGHDFFQGTMPRLVSLLERLVDNLEQNQGEDEAQTVLDLEDECESLGT